jgi:hypothetical protein
LCAAIFTIVRTAKQAGFRFKNRLVLKHSSTIPVSKPVCFPEKQASIPVHLKGRKEKETVIQTASLKSRTVGIVGQSAAG